MALAENGQPRIQTEGLTAYYGTLAAVKQASLAFAPNQVHALIGPSGCGKSTFLRTLNRMHEETPGARVEGSVALAHRATQLCLAVSLLAMISQRWLIR